MRQSSLPQLLRDQSVPNGVALLINRRHCGRLVYVIDLASINATVVSSTVIKGRVRSEWSRSVRTPIQHDFETFSETFSLYRPDAINYTFLFVKHKSVPRSRVYSKDSRYGNFFRKTPNFFQLSITYFQTNTLNGTIKR
jgi:hypothetical protein